MPNIERFQSSLKRHPVIALTLLAALTVLSAPLGLVAALACGCALVLPALLARRPEMAIEIVEEQARADSLRLIHTTGAMGADRVEMVREAERMAFHARQWEDRAAKAVLGGNDEEASACLDRKRYFLERLAAVRVELEQQTAAVAEMNREVDARWPGPEESGPSNLRFLPARARRAEARKQAALDRSGLVRSPLHDVARRVQRAEDEAQAIEETISRSRDPLAEKYERAEAEERAARDLEELKQRVGMRRPVLDGKKVG